MPIIMCSYCHYVGQSKESKFRSYEEEIQDVEEHEKTCPERIALEEE